MDTFARLAAKHKRLSNERAYNTGGRVVILAAGVDPEGKPDLSERLLNEQLAYWYEVHTSRDMGIPLDEVDTVIDAGKEHFAHAVRDRSVGHIILLGHAAYDLWLTRDGPITWETAGDMVDSHLKNGMFANLGCGRYAPDVEMNVPLGNFVVSDEGLLVGKQGEAAEMYKAGSFDYFEELPKVR